MQIEQIDRDAAADLIEAQYAREGVPPGRLQTPNETRIGDRDHCVEVQRMARHRLAALSPRPVDSDMVERVAKVLCLDDGQCWTALDGWDAPYWGSLEQMRQSYRQKARAAIAAITGESA